MRAVIDMEKSKVVIVDSTIAERAVHMPKIRRLAGEYHYSTELGSEPDDGLRIEIDGGKFRVEPRKRAGAWDGVVITRLKDSLTRMGFECAS